MIIPVHQALFGEVNRGHGLLVSSLPETTLRSMPQLATDLPGSSIPPDLEWEPYIRGYRAGNYYIISKTFPDPDASRHGMVFTHVLLLDLAEICQLNDLAPVFHLLPKSIEKPSSLQALQVSATELTTPHVIAPGYGKVVNTLLNNPQHTVIWVGNDGFVQIVESLWKNLWPNTRREFSFRISFAPQDLQDSPPTIACIPEALVGRWTHESLVHITDEYMPNPSDEMYLAEAFLMGLP
ncbi:MAG TPA: hypothetical protein P5280_03870 [Cyclobacteriaceae bacterium]|nr:hypothetical protein [Cyclobacteriaceae bacterium]